MSQSNNSSSLQRQQESFKKALKNQPVFQRKNLIAIAAGDYSKPEALRPDITESKGQRHFYSYVHAIILLLKNENKPLSVEEIKEKIHVDLNANKELLECIITNEKILYSAGKFLYKPVYNVRTRETLIDLLKQNRDSGQGGVEMSELKESFTGTIELAHELHLSQDLLCLKNAKDDSMMLLYYNDFKYPLNVDQQFKDAWHDLKLPDDHDIQKELDRAGLKIAEVMDAAANRKHEKPKKKPRKNFRRTKITNVHLNIDLLQDLES